jgi:hypothetical protein
LQIYLKKFKIPKKMAENNKKVYFIEINGLQESIDGVKSLNQQLASVEARINQLQSKKINIGVGGGASVSSNSSQVSVEKELNKIKEEGTRLEAKQAAYEDEAYRKLLAQKDILKAIETEEKAIAASERLIADNYKTDTMQGLKQKLADTKAAMQTKEVGGEDFKTLTAQANELNAKLLEIEKSYGQFGRQVGNYKVAAEGFKGLKIQVGETTQEFDNAKQAYKELANELRTLQVKKDQGMLLSEEEKQRFEALPTVVAQLRSSIQDAGKPLDSLMDTMQSVVALAQAGKGISAFFGVDDGKVEETIKQLVALQNAMKGIETINKQLQSGEFLGGWLSRGNQAVDNFVTKIFGAKKATEALTTAQKANNVVTDAGTKSSKALATAENVQTVATTQATVATKALSTALKSIGIGLVIALVATLIEYWDDLVDWFEDTIPALKNIGDWFNKLIPILSGVGKVLVDRIIMPFKTLGEIIKAVIEGNFKDIPKIVIKNLAESFDVVKNYQEGYNKAVENQQKKHNKKMLEEQKKANDDAEKDAEARYGKDYNRTQKYYKDQMSLLDKQLANTKKGSDEYKAILEEKQDYQRKLWNSERQEQEEANKNAKKLTEEELKLLKARIENMEEGLEKKLALLDLEMQNELKDVKKNSELYIEIEKKYNKKKEEVTKEFTEAQKKAYADMWKEIHALAKENAQNTLKLEEEEIKRTREEKLNKVENNVESYSTQGVSVVQRGNGYEVLKENDLDYTKRLEDEYQTRTANLKKYLEEVERIEAEAAIKLRDNALQQIELDKQSRLTALRNSYNAQDEALKKKLKDGLISQKQYKEASNRLEEERAINEANITQEAWNKRIAEHKKYQDKLVQLEVDSDKQILDNYEGMIDKLQSIDTSEVVRNGFGFTNLKATKERNNRIIQDYQNVLLQIQTKTALLQQKLDGVKTEKEREEIQKLIDKLKEMGVAVTSSMANVTSDTASATDKLKSDIQTYAQAVGDVANSVISIIGSIQDAAYEREMDELDKQLEAIEKKYDEMDALEQEHANNMQSLEDQIANAQGSARDRLIQRYMVEKQAQKEALAEKKKAAKEEEKIKEQQEKLEKEHLKEQKKRDLITAAINTAMMITFAGMTQPFVPVGLAMMATAAAAGAAQIAAIQAQQYAEGGQLEGGLAVGARHRDGGIKVLGGRAEIEGGEYVTNRTSTANNLDLLEFINAKKARVNIADLIDFYGGEKMKNRINKVKTHFEDGGQVPTLVPLDYSDRLLTVIEDYSNRPVQVAVVDIIDRSQEVNDVKVLAGL